MKNNIRSIFLVLCLLFIGVFCFDNKIISDLGTDIADGSVMDTGFTDFNNGIIKAVQDNFSLILFGTIIVGIPCLILYCALGMIYEHMNNKEKQNDHDKVTSKDESLSEEDRRLEQKQKQEKKEAISGCGCLFIIIIFLELFIIAINSRII